MGQSREQYLAVDIGGTFTKYAVMDRELNITGRGKVPTVTSSSESFVGMIEEIFRSKAPQAAGIGISSAGVMDVERGIMHNAGSITCVHELPIVQILSDRCGVPVSIGNDAHCAAQAELWRGSLSDVDNAVVLVLGTAVGGTVIVNGRILEGAHHMAGELSYCLTDSTDALNPMKTMAMTGGVPALIRAAEAASGEKGLTGETIFARAIAGEEVFLEALRGYARGIAVLIGNCQYMVDPERVAIGGGVSAQPLLIELIRQELRALCGIYPYPVPVPEVTACRFFNDANLIGALCPLLREEGGQES